MRTTRLVGARLHRSRLNAKGHFRFPWQTRPLSSGDIAANRAPTSPLGYMTDRVLGQLTGWKPTREQFLRVGFTSTNSSFVQPPELDLQPRSKISAPWYQMDHGHSTMKHRRGHSRNQTMRSLSHDSQNWDPTRMKRYQHAGCKTLRVNARAARKAAIRAGKHRPNEIRIGDKSLIHNPGDLQSVDHRPDIAPT
jgi:hypothetical protein